jgi:branched-chain amino acid transport system permease protein
MADALNPTAPTSEADPPTSGNGIRVAPGISYRKALRYGVIGGVVTITFATIGALQTFQTKSIINGVLNLGFLGLGLLPLIIGMLAARLPAAKEGYVQAKAGPRNIIAGLLVGFISGELLLDFALFVQVVDIRAVFINVSPQMVSLIAFGQANQTVGLVLMLLSTTILGGIGGLLEVMPKAWRGALVGGLTWIVMVGLFDVVFSAFFRGAKLKGVDRFLYSPAGGLHLQGAIAVFVIAAIVYFVRESQGHAVGQRYRQLPDGARSGVKYGGLAALVLILLILPGLLGPFVSEVLDLVGIYMLMGLGLNIVVGLAGLLDLGYVAFFAVGAYTTAVLTSPASPAVAPELTFWLAIPFVLLAAALAGLIVGTPVLRMRGDYLAIVTLGFGEIARLLVTSAWFKPLLGGAQGILKVPAIVIHAFVGSPIVFNTPPKVLYLVALFCLIAAYVSWRLKDSRVGRAWMAMREDEDVAEAMGVNIVEAKLKAFITGAVLASIGGALFATKIGSIFPNSFNIIVSITVLVIIIVGGMGSIPGVVVGAFVLVGVPQLLREFQDFQFLAYGILLIIMMLHRPEGLIPSREWARELHEEELSQDAWLKDVKQQDAEAAEGGAAAAG